MAIRITGMYSGLDTESIINELASAQSYKKNKLVKEQTKLSWKQDAWKALNTKIYSFYQKLDDLRLQSSYLKKKTVVSNPNALTVSGGTVDGSHKVSVQQLSRQAALTSGSLAKGNTHYTGYATLKQLGMSGSGSIRLSDAGGNFVDIDVDENMTINDFVKKVNDNTALKASFDQDNQRIYLNSWASGKEGEFFLTGNDAGGTAALQTLKLMSATDLKALTAEGGEYDVWSKYVNVDITGASPSYSSANYTDAYKKLIQQETLKRLQAMKAENEKLAKANETCDKANKKNLDTFKEIKENKDGKYDAYQDYINGYKSSWDINNDSDLAEIKAAGEALYNKIYGEQDKEADGTPKVDADGKPVIKTPGMAQELEGLQDDLKAAQADLKQKEQDLADGVGGVTQADVDAAKAAVTTASEAVSKKQSEIDKAKEVYSVYSAFDQNLKEKADNQAKIDANNARFTYDAETKTYKEKVVKAGSDPDNPTYEEVAVGEGTTAQEVAKEFDQRVIEAQKMMNKVQHNADGTFEITDADLKKQLGDEKNSGTKVSGEDAMIKVDGVTYTSSTDTLTVNGMTITALEQTDKDVTVSTKTDTEGVYNMLKDFIKSYSDLMNEMDALYNAESSKGYDPLLSEEKDALTDTEIEEWEKKIKDSLLRRDSTLSDVSSSIRMDMMMTMTIGGKTYSLADFGIETQSYWKAKDNERNAYHILGDKDDPLSWEPEAGKPDLSTMIAKEPEAVMEFFTSLSTKLHDTIADKMSTTKMSSALTVYNDKKMKEDYDDYTKKIKDQEEKLNAYIDKWYAKFSAMEVALSKLESKNSSLSSLFGG